MPDPDDISQDRGFKALFSSYPRETIEVFVPELLAERGQPTEIEMLQQETVRPELDEPSRFLDIALLASWRDGSQAVVLLVEHWSEVRKVDLRRVLWYVADLALRYPLAVVFPVMLVTDPRAMEAPDRLEMTVAGITTVTLRVRVSRVSATELPRLRSLQNRVAAMLITLGIRDKVEGVLSALEQMARSPGPLDDLERFLPFAMKLARMPASDLPRFRSRLLETGMINIITEMKAEARAEGEAKGKAEGKAEGEAKGKAEGEAKGRLQAANAMVASISRLVVRGVLTRDVARAEIQDLIDTGAIPSEVGQAALVQFV